MTEFDPYHKWLGIPPAEQPTNYYRLLGISLFEDDAEVIDAAADQRMAFVQQMSTGKHLELSQQLLNELSSARFCLLNSEQKAEYDLSLKVTIDAKRGASEEKTVGTSLLGRLTQIASQLMTARSGSSQESADATDRHVKKPFLQSTTGLVIALLCMGGGFYVISWETSGTDGGAKSASNASEKKIAVSEKEIVVASRPESTKNKDAGKPQRIPIAKKDRPQLLTTLTGDTDSVMSVAFSPDGKTLATGSYKVLRLWDVETAEQQAKFSAVSYALLAFSPDGKTLASTESDRISLRDFETFRTTTMLEGKLQNPQSVAHSQGICSVAFSPDGKTLASGGWYGTTKLWDVETGRERMTLIGRSGRTNSVAFSPDGKLLASACRDKTVKLWEVETGDLLNTLTGHSDRVHSVAFSPDGTKLVSGSKDATIKLWDVETLSELDALTGHTDDVNFVAFSPDGKTLASGCEDNTIKLWDVETARELETLTGHLDRVHCVAFSPDGKLLASGSRDATTRLWELRGYAGQPAKLLQKEQVLQKKKDERPRERSTLNGHSSLVHSVAFSPDGKTLASGSHDRTIRLWDVETGEERSTLTGDSNVYSIAFSPDGKKLASGSRDRTIRLWDVETGEERAKLNGYTSDVWSVEFSPDGKKLASGSRNGVVSLWDVDTNKEINSLWGNSDHHVNSVAFSPDGKIIASGSDDKTIKLWDVEKGQLRATLTGHLNRVVSVAYSPNGKIIASGSDDKTIKLWDVEKGLERATLKGHSDRVVSIAFSPDGKKLASGSDDKTIMLWDVGKGQLRTTLNGHSNRVVSVAFSPDGTTLASGSDDKTIKLWELRGYAGQPAAGFAKSSGKTVDLLKLIDLKRDVVEGDWQQDGTALIGTREFYSRLQIPYLVPDEYQIEVEVERLSGKHLFCVGLVKGITQFRATLDFSDGKKSALGTLDGIENDVNESTYEGGIFQQGQKSTVVITVRDSGVKVVSDGKPIIDWKGNFNRLKLHPNWVVPNKSQLFIGSHRCSYRISKLELRPLSVDGEEVPKQTVTKPIDLLKIINPETDDKHGNWSFDGDVLVSPPNTNQARLEPNYDFPNEYQITAVVTRIPDSGRYPGLVFGLSRGSSQFHLLTDVGMDDQRNSIGLMLLNGKRWTENKTGAKGFDFQDNRPTTIVCRVTDEGVNVVIDGKSAIDWKGDYSELSHPPTPWKKPKHNHIFLGTNSSYRISKLELRPLSVDGERPLSVEVIEVPKQTTD